MFKRQPSPISPLLQTILRNNGLETPLLQRRLIDAWDDVAGEIVARYTTEKVIRNQTLFVRLQHPALRSELSMKKSILVQNLNATVGAQIINDIRLI